MKDSRVTARSALTAPPADRFEGSFVTLYYVENIRSTENTNFPFQKLPRPNACLSSSRRRTHYGTLLQYIIHNIANIRVYNITLPIFYVYDDTTAGCRGGWVNRGCYYTFRHRSHVVMLIAQDPPPLTDRSVGQGMTYKAYIMYRARV